MASLDPNMSLTQSGKMGGMQKAGATLVALGLFAALISFLGSRIQPYIPLSFGMAGLVSGFVILTRKDPRTSTIGKILLGIGFLSLVLMILVSQEKLGMEDWAKKDMGHVNWILFALIFGGTSLGALLIYFEKFGRGPAGIRNNGIMQSEATRKQGTIGWILTILFTGFYVVLYWFPENLAGLIEVVKPLKFAISGNEDNAQWFLYTFTYTIFVLVMGTRFILKYRHSRYQVARTVSVSFFQLGFAFLFPYLLIGLGQKQGWNHKDLLENHYGPVYWEYKSAKAEFLKADSTFQASQGSVRDSLGQMLPALKQKMEEKKTAALPWFKTMSENSPKAGEEYFTYFWPLAYDKLWPDNIEYKLGVAPEDGIFVPYETKAGFGGFGLIVIFGALGMSTIGVVVLTYFFGKRWYCSWVCGCGGLAETAGDSFRQLSDKSLKAWRVERVLIYSVLLLITVITLLVLIDWKAPFLGHTGHAIKSGYKFTIGLIFAGVVGTGFYPILGSRVWCRFGCPQAAILGFLQKKFSRFRITTNGSQCISCGNCSTYCEMGIDVKSYAQRGQDIVRASCVGCGICSSVCPRGVLNLENGPLDKKNLDAHTVSGIDFPVN